MSVAPVPSAPAGLLVNSQRPITFTYEGQTVPALEGQSIGAALYAFGQRIFTRSFKYHRPRGLLCVSGDCPNCLMHVDGRPNVRTCVEPARQGQVVIHQNAWPSLNFDLLRTFDRMDRFLPVGFYYRRFHKPRWLWPIFEHSVRHIAGLGRIDVNSIAETHAEVEYLHPDICVVGGGPAGLAAATTAAHAGAQVLLIDKMPRLGGHWLYQGNSLSAVDTLVGNLKATSARILNDTTAFGLYEENLLGAFQGDRLLKIRARQIIICTGGREQPFVFHNNDLPGIFLTRGVQRLARCYGVKAGSKAVVVSDRDEGEQLAEELSLLGFQIAGLIDPRPSRNGPSPRKGPWSTYSSSVIVKANGNKRLTSIQLARRDAAGALDPNSEQIIDCDLVCMSSSLVPANELLLQGGGKFQLKEGRWQQTRGVSGTSAAGAAAGNLDSASHILEGRLRGAEAAQALGRSVPALEDHRRAWQASQASQAGSFSSAQSCLFTQAKPGDRKRFLCLCEDVTEKDIHQAVAEGFDNLETLKRYSTVTMGPCQGKMCHHASVEACSLATGRDLCSIGSTTARPPAVPVEMGVLAAARHHPIRRTPLHHWHQAAGATWMDAGLWKRPESYGDPLAEVRAVRNCVGLIDVSTLGKIEVIGPDAAEFLERVYINKWRDLKEGRIRYGVMCNEDGILFDDGVAARLAPNHYYLTATTGNAEVVVQWLEMWKATWGINVAILDKTSAFASMNLAGPHSREVLTQITTLDLSPTAFPYLGYREEDIAGVRCRLLRIGFVGEMGYEIHCPTSQARHLWESLMQAGKNHGIQTFGVEAQRILRLEKGHIIIGVDTDALSNPLEAGLEGMVRLEKPMFLGHGPLRRFKDMGPRSRLVGFFLNEAPPSALSARHSALISPYPPEGSQVVDQGRSVGRITSIRFSPTLNKILGLAWVPASKAKPGESILIRWNGSDTPATVAQLPFYDPEGQRLKS